MAVKEYHFSLWLSKFPNMDKKVNYGRGKMYADTGLLTLNLISLIMRKYA